VQIGLAELIACGRARLAGGTLLSCANFAGCAGRSEFAGHAAYGYCAAKSRWYWGVRLLLICDHHGAPLGYDLRPANENEREGVFQLASAHPNSCSSPMPVTAAVSIMRASIWSASNSSCPRGTGSTSVCPAR